jgi:flagellar hook-basal body complex protein FliE
MTPLTTTGAPFVPNFALAKSAAAPAGSSFQDLLSQAMKSANDYQLRAESAQLKDLSGDDASLIESTNALRQADLTLQLTLQVRNKLLEAYNEIKGMQF